MRKLFAILASVGLSYNPAVSAEVDPAIHKLCIEAKDYAGCVKAMSGGTSSSSEVGNKCQAQFAYVGDGNCQRVGCKYGWWLSGSGNHNRIVAGKSKWECPRQFRSGVFLTGSLILEEIAPIGFDQECPPVEPEIGWNSSCETAPKNWRELEEAKKEAEYSKCDFKLRAYKCSYNAYLEANPGIKKWAELNPELANKERSKLNATD